MLKGAPLSVREITINDLSPIAGYWTQNSADYMRGMGVDVMKLPQYEEWITLLKEQIDLPYSEKKSYCTIWELQGKAIGHCNVNKIIFGKEAYIHLHLWESTLRKSGYGPALLRLSIPYFFHNLDLKTIYCEPYALNPAPNAALPKLGFRLTRSYVGVPGFICFEQKVNVWELHRSEFFDPASASG